MGILSDWKAVTDVQRIKNGGIANLSISQITNLIVNLPDAQKRLPASEFQKVYDLYRCLRKCKTKIPMDLDGYFDTAARIIFIFDQIAPYEHYSGGDSIEASFLLNDVRKMSAEEPDFAAKIMEQIRLYNKHGNPETIRPRHSKLVIVLSIGLIFMILAYCGTKMNLDHSRDRLDEVNAALNVMEKNYDSLSEQYESIVAQRNEMKSELYFWQDYAVIVTEHGEKYHTYGCQYIEGRDFWIYNVGAAIGWGYTPCSVCNPPSP